MNLLEFLYLTLILATIFFVFIAMYVAKQLVQTLQAVERVALDVEHLSAEAIKLKALAASGWWGTIGKLVQPFVGRR